jgi:hypothetical protein
VRRDCYNPAVSNEQTTKFSAPITSLTVFHFERGARLWAFAQMGLARPLLHGKGLRFHRLMGTGRGLGFTVAPDWGRYALLAVWDDEDVARRFLASSALMRRYRARATRIASVLLSTISAHGAWDGRNPFLPAASLAGEYAGPLAVLTRATIHPTRLRPFWRQMSEVSARLASSAGRLASIGIGEAPFVRQATFSLWQDVTLMQQFAYHSEEHRRTIRQTRAGHWYSEELFARFIVLEQDEDFP